MSRWTFTVLLFPLIPLSALAQDPTAAPPPKPSPSTTSTDSTKKPKKVWTNDDMSTVHGSVSVVGDSNSNKVDSSSAAKSNRTDGKDLHQQQIEKYRNQIQQLQSQIDAANKQIAQLKNFKADNTSPSGGINPSHPYNMVPIEDQMKQLEDKKRSLVAKIEDVEAEASHDGIDPGELR